MAVLKCKMCGGSLTVNDESGVAVCEYCGTRQTISKTTDDVVSNLYNRANNLRLKNEFDKALNIYEKIVEQDDSEAEAHWGLVLCKYGIEYVDDPNTGKKIPTCHRTSFDSIKSDIDYQAAIDYSSPDQQLLYEEEAREIDRLQKDILNIAKNEKPFDVFICYKETDESGKRTVDSVIANDIYYQLTQEGFKAFYAAITLEDKLGQEYEPYIFAALNSAKVMLVIGTKPEYFNAVWVKNEWSRYLSLMKKDRTKILIPCYRDMDAYDLPDEFAHLQAQDMSKIGFINDVIRGIRKIVVKDEPKPVVNKAERIVNTGFNADAVLRRAFMFLEDGDFKSADEYFDRVLDNDPENGEAYLGKLLVEKKITSIDNLVSYYQDLYSEDDSKDIVVDIIDTDHIIKMADQYAVPGYYEKNEILPQYIFNNTITSSVQDRIEQAGKIEKELTSNRLLSRFVSYSKDSSNDLFEKIRASYKERIEKARHDEEEKKEEIKKQYQKFLNDTDDSVVQKNSQALENRENDYQSYIKETENITSVSQAENMISKFSSLNNYKDSASYIETCNKKINELNEIEKRNKENAARKRKKAAVTISVIAVVLVILGIFYMTILAPLIKYNKAVSLYKNGDYASSYSMFNELGDYKDSESYKEKAYPGYVKSNLSNCSIGDIVKMGSYEQDNDSSNGKEVIEWKVLAKEGNKVLLISQYALNYQQYNTSRTDVTWETCSLRLWLNDEFYNEAFSDTDKQLITTSTVTADKNPSYGTNQGNDTSDKVFLLSINEVNKYFSSSSDKECKYKYKDNCWWWLRTSGSSSINAAYVSIDGSVYAYGRIGDSGSATRPAMWVSIE